MNAQEGSNVNKQNNGNLFIIIASVGALFLCCVIGLIVLFAVVIPKTSLFAIKPPHYGVFIKQGGNLLELQERQIFDIPIEREINNAETISDSQPIIVVWRDNLNLDYLTLYKLGQYLNQHQKIAFIATPKDNGIIEITPTSSLSSGVYCLVQGDPLAAFLPGWCFQLGSVGENQQSTPPVAVSSGTIRIWKVGTSSLSQPLTNNIPTEFQALSQKQGYQVTIEVFPEDGFSEIFLKAFAENKVPDILLSTSYSPDRSGVQDDVYKNTVNVNGLDYFNDSHYYMAFLFKSSAHYEQVKPLVFQNIKCKNESKSDLDSNQDLKQSITDVATAFYNEDESALNKLSTDGKYYKEDSYPLFPEYASKVQDVLFCNIWGSKNIAFVDALAIFDGPRRIGRENVLYVMQPQNGKWKLLFINGNYDFVRNLSTIKLESSDSGIEPMSPLALVAPPNNSKQDAIKTYLEWTDTGDSTATYLLEEIYGWGKAPDIAYSSQSKLILLGKVTKVKPSSWSGPYKWRIWAIDRAGRFVISEWRIIDFSQ